MYFVVCCVCLRTAVGVWAMKQPFCSHLHKITNEPVFMALAPYDFAAGQRHFLGNWKGRALKIETFLVPETAGAKQELFGPKN